jgi:hypothetical protein
MEEMTWEKLKGKGHLGELGIDVKMDIKYVGCEECGLVLSGSGWSSVAGFCEHGNEPSGYTNG